jgi:hypothetical protein
MASLTEVAEHAAPALESMPQSAPGEPEAIFVVGASRSGTTLMRNLLERSPRIALAQENHFVGHVIRREGARFYFRRLGDPASDETIRQLVEFIYSGGYQRKSRIREVSPYWRWLTKEIPREELERRLLATDRTERAVFSALMRVYADWRGRPVMGEKTPAHLAYVDELLDWFPDGRVIHMLRDPRAVYVSDHHRRTVKRRKPYSLLMHVPLLFSAVLLFQTMLVWRSAARRHFIYAQRYPTKYRLVRFEEVVQTPEPTLAGIFEFLGIELPAQPTDVQVYAHGFRSGDEGIDAGAATRWRENIHPFAERLMTFMLRRQMRKFGFAH